MVCFQTKNPNLGKVLQWKMMVYFMVHFTVFCYILLTIGIVRGNLVSFSRFGIFFPFWYLFPVLVSFFRIGILYQEKSGNPVSHRGVRQRPTKHGSVLTVSGTVVRHKNHVSCK
jgi:hypothetical protein